MLFRLVITFLPRSKHLLMSWPQSPSAVILESPKIKSGLPGGLEVKASAWNAGDLGSVPGLGRSPGEGNGNPHQYSCLENPMEGGAW